MPNPTSGFTGNEIVERITRYIGNRTAEFKIYVQESLPLAEYRFCKMHDWSFLKKVSLSLPIITGQAQYELSSSTIGHYMAASDVESIYDEEKGVYLKKMELAQIRRFDPANNDGSNIDNPRIWAPVNDNQIVLWPPVFADGELKVDGKITPIAMTNLATFPTIPYRYQESFIEYMIAMALDRENDDRASAKKAEALQLVRADIQDDLRNSGSTENPRLKGLREASADGSTGNYEGYLLSLFYGD